MKQKICALAVTAALSISLFTTPAFAAETSFTDVSGHWAEEAVSAVVEKGLFNGTSEDTFSPDVSMNRGMFVTVLGRFAEGMGFEVSGTSAFEDVPADAYFARYVAWGAENGIVNGVSETSFAPDADVTREQMCALFVRFLDFIKYPIPETGELTFLDADSISDWAVEPVKTAVTLGLIQGKPVDDGMAFDPDGKATRAEVATVFLRLDGLEGIYDLQPAEPETPTEPETPVEPTPTPAPTPTPQPEPVDPNNGGGGGGGGGGGVTPQPQPKPEPTKEEKEKEEKIVSYLEEMVENYKNMPYLGSTHQDVQDAYAILMDTIQQALAAHNNKEFLSQDYVKTHYSKAVDDVKSRHKAMDEKLQTEFKNVGLRLGNTMHTKEVLEYFGFSTNGL